MPPYVSSTCDEYEVLYRQVGGFTGTDWNGHNYTNLKHGNANGLTVEDLWPDLKTVDDWQQFIADMMSRSVRLTTQNNRDADETHPGWARVPRGSNPCAFCVMLASRGFAYTSEESADFGGSFHNGKCRCIPVCSWGKDKPSAMTKRSIKPCRSGRASHQRQRIGKELEVLRRGSRNQVGFGRRECRHIRYAS